MIARWAQSMEMDHPITDQQLGLFPDGEFRGCNENGGDRGVVSRRPKDSIRIGPGDGAARRDGDADAPRPPTASQTPAQSAEVKQFDQAEETEADAETQQSADGRCSGPKGKESSLHL